MLMIVQFIALALKEQKCKRGRFVFPLGNNIHLVYLQRQGNSEPSCHKLRCMELFMKVLVDMRERAH